MKVRRPAYHVVGVLLAAILAAGCSTDDPDPDGDVTMDVVEDTADECEGVTYHNSHTEPCPERRITCYPGTIDCEPFGGNPGDTGDVVCDCMQGQTGFWSWDCSTGC